MEKEGIIDIHLNPKSGKLTLKFSNNQSQTIEDENLTSEQKAIKEFFQQTGKTSLNRDQVRAEVEKMEKKDDKKWLGPVIGGGIVVVLLAIFIGVIVYYKNRKKK